VDRLRLVTRADPDPDAERHRLDRLHRVADHAQAVRQHRHPRPLAARHRIGAHRGIATRIATPIATGRHRSTFGSLNGSWRSISDRGGGAPSIYDGKTCDRAGRAPRLTVLTCGRLLAYV